MLTCNSKFRESCNSDIIKSQFKLYFSISKTGTTLCTLTDKDLILNKCNTTKSSTSGSSFTVGGVVSSKLTVRLTQDGADLVTSSGAMYKNICIHVVQWNKVDDSSQSSTDYSLDTDNTENTSGKLDLGYYYINTISNKDYFCDITAYDCIQRFDTKLGSTQLSYLKNNKKTISGWLSYFCTQLNTTYYSFSYNVKSNIVNTSVSVCLSDDSSIDTYRQALGYLSSLAGGFCESDQNGDVVIKGYEFTSITDTVSDRYLTDVDLDSGSSTITYMFTSIAGFDVHTSISNVANTNNIEMYISENVLLRGLESAGEKTLNSSIGTAVDNIFALLIGKEFYGGSFKTTPRPFNDLGDKITVSRVVASQTGSLSTVLVSIIVTSISYNFGVSTDFSCDASVASTSTSSSGKFSSTAIQSVTDISDIASGAISYKSGIAAYRKGSFNYFPETTLYDLLNNSSYTTSVFDTELKNNVKTDYFIADWNKSYLLDPSSSDVTKYWAYRDSSVSYNIHIKIDLTKEDILGIVLPYRYDGDGDADNVSYTVTGVYCYVDYGINYYEVLKDNSYTGIIRNRDSFLGAACSIGDMDKYLNIYNTPSVSDALTNTYGVESASKSCTINSSNFESDNGKVVLGKSDNINVSYVNGIDNYSDNCSTAKSYAYKWKRLSTIISNIIVYYRTASGYISGVNFNNIVDNWYGKTSSGGYKMLDKEGYTGVQTFIDSILKCITVSIDDMYINYTINKSNSPSDAALALSTKADKTAVDTLVGRVNQNSNDISDLQNTVVSLQSQIDSKSADITTINQSITDINTSISSLDARIKALGG